MENEVIFKWEYLLFAFLILTLVVFLVLLLVIPVKMANRRGRSGTLWFFVSMIISPFLSMLFLFLLGETDEKRKERIIEEERLRNLYRNPEAYSETNHQSNLDIWFKENPGKTINDYYRSK